MSGRVGAYEPASFTGQVAELNPSTTRSAREPWQSPAPLGDRAASADADLAAATDDQQESRSRLLLRRRERPPAPRSSSLAARLDESASARPGPATRAIARTGKLAPLLLGLVVHVIGCRGEPATMPGGDASSTRNDTPSAAAVAHVLWARRHREARPPGAPAAGSIVTGTTQRLSMSWRSWPLGHSLGQTLPYWAVPGPTRSTCGRDELGRFAGISVPGSPTNAMLHTREVAGSKPAAPIVLRQGVVRYGTDMERGSDHAAAASPRMQERRGGPIARPRTSAARA
jgi:hypothetical protein